MRKRLHPKSLSRQSKLASLFDFELFHKKSKLHVKNRVLRARLEGGRIGPFQILVTNDFLISSRCKII